MTGLEERAGKLSASVFAVNIVVSVDKGTVSDAVAHSLTLSHRIHQTVCLIVIGLNSAGEVRECERITVVRRLGSFRRRWALQALRPKRLQDQAKLLAQSGDASVDGARTVVPARFVVDTPWSDGRAVVVGGS